MKNLFSNPPLTSDEIAAALAWPRPLLLPPLGSDEWRRVAANPMAPAMIAPLRELAEADIGVPMPLLTDELYADFYATGQRIPFERVYVDRRRRVGRAALCALLADEHDRDRWVESFIEKVTDIFNEESWSLPAHVYTEPTGKNRMMIDLFCAETANLMGETITMFGAVLPPELIASMKARLEETVFQNFIENHARFVWADITNNWNAVCHQGILGAALAVAEPNVCAAMLMIARGNLEHYWAGIGADGGCQEGPGYWSYGFGWYSVLGEQLETATRGAISLLRGDERSREASLYPTRVVLTNGHLVNFSDCNPDAVLNPRLLRYLGKLLDEPSLTTLGDTGYASLLKTGLDVHNERCDLFYLARLFLDLPATIPEPTPLAEFAHYFGDMEVLVSRSRDCNGHLWEFAAKARHNGEHHNHNDCGNYLLNIDGEQMVYEIGAPEYTRAFFSPRRYEDLAARTLGHSLPIVNGCEQAAGEEYAAKVVECALAEGCVRFVLDLTRCYPAEAACRSLVRSLVLDTQAGRLSLTDEYELERVGTIESAIIAKDAIEAVSTTEAVVRSGPVSITICAGDSVQFGDIETHGYSDHSGNPQTIKRIALKPCSNATSGSVSYTIECLGPLAEHAQ